MRATRLVVWASLLVPSSLFAAERPGPLPDEAGCQHYRGTSSGNDPSVRLDVVLCPSPDGGPGRVVGKLQWSSLLSGWNLRKVAGRWDAATLTLRDLEILEERPESGYRFCIIDAYVLAQDSSGGLKGTYDSAECDDHAKVALEAVHAEPGAAAAPAREEPVAPTKPEAPRDPSDAAPPKAQDSRGAAGCGCDASLLFFLPLVGLRRRRRPARGLTRARRSSPTRRP